MKLVTLSEKEYKQFAYNHPLFSFHQAIAWGKLKKTNGWDYKLLGLKDNNDIKASVLFLVKKAPLNKKIFYAPHGFLIDYNNHEILKTMINNVKKYVKENNGFFFKIDPYLMKIRRDKYGKIVENDIDNTSNYNYLINNGFIEVNKKEKDVSLQSKWLYWIDIENKTLDEVMKEMTSKTRQMIRKNEKNGVYIRESNSKEIDLFYDVMENTSKRHGFINRDKSYHKKMLDLFSEEDLMKMYVAEINLEQQVNRLIKEKDILVKETKDEEQKFNEGKLKVNKKKFNHKIKDNYDMISRIDKQLIHYKELIAKEGKIIQLAAIIFVKTKNEIVSFIGGAYEKYLEFQPFYTMNYELLKKAIDLKLKKYNFYSILSNVDKNSENYGVYAFKKDFGGEVVELIGEFDYPINKGMYYLYKLAFALLKMMKKVKTKLKQLLYKIKK